MEICDISILMAPRACAAELPRFTEAHPARDGGASASDTPSIHPIVRALDYNFADNTFWGQHPLNDVLLSVPVHGTVAIRGSPRTWRVTLDAPTALGDVLLALYRMLLWCMSGVELALYARSGDEYRRVMTQCATRCADSGEPYRGEESLRRVDWLRGHTRLVGIAWSHDVQAWLLDLSA